MSMTTLVITPPDLSKDWNSWVCQEDNGKLRLEHLFRLAQQTEVDQIIVASTCKDVLEKAVSLGAIEHYLTEPKDHVIDCLSDVVVSFDLDDHDLIIPLPFDRLDFKPIWITGMLKEMLSDKALRVSTAARLISDKNDLFDPSVVKVVLNHRSNAMYFSRAAIFWEREHFDHVDQVTSLHADHFAHIDAYIYRVAMLESLLIWSSSDLDKYEDIPILKVLWHGGRIRVALFDDDKLMHLGFDDSEI